jgi:hypothetical protein
VKDAVRIHLAALLRELRGDWPPAAIGHGLDRLDRTGLPDRVCAGAAIACATDPDGHPADMPRYRAKPAVLDETNAALNVPDPERIARGAAHARAVVEAAIASKNPALPHPDPTARTETR